MPVASEIGATKTPSPEEILARARDLDTLALLPEESTVENLMAEADLQLTRAFRGMTLKSLALSKPASNLADARLAIRDHQNPGGAS